MAEAYQRIAALRPANTSEQELYEVPAVTEIVGILSICNQDADERTVQVAHTDVTGAATGEDWLIYDHIIQANETIQITGIAMGAAETIRVQASVADQISFILSGLVKT